MSADAALARRLGTSLPAEIAGLPDDALAALDAMVAAAVDARAAELDAGIAKSLSHAPRLARPAIKKVLGL